MIQIGDVFSLSPCSCGFVYVFISGFSQLQRGKKENRLIPGVFLGYLYW